MGGELLGLKAIGTELHTWDAVLLEDPQVCQIPFEWREGWRAS